MTLQATHCRDQRRASPRARRGHKKRIRRRHSLKKTNLRAIGYPKCVVSSMPEEKLSGVRRKRQKESVKSMKTRNALDASVKRRPLSDCASKRLSALVKQRPLSD